MTSERRLLLQQLTRQALELDAGERDSFIERACGMDSELRSDLELLLAAEVQQTGRFEVSEDVAAAPAAIVDSLASGQFVGRFQVIGHLGSGGMGDVYLARDPRLGRRLAIKLISTHFATDSERVLRFNREARTASSLNHPYICAVYDTGETEDGRPFIAMEHVQGQTLRQRLALGPLPLDEALTIVRQAAEGLAAAHQVGIVHRDIKPENLMLRDDGYVKVLDFGLAKLFEERASEGASDMLQTGAGRIIGTPYYMSPEQARGQAVDARTDVWSLGAVFYELVTGKPPFAGRTAADLVSSILLTEPEPLTEHVAGMPAGVQRVIERTLRKRAEERYASCVELARELKQLGQALAVGDIRVDSEAPGPTGISGWFATFAETQTDGPARPTNLPDRTSRLIGRERECADITAALRSGEVRLLTLTGPGGTGKTRLAVEAGRLLLRDFADGVFAVDLSQLSDPLLVVVHVAHELGLKELSGNPVAEQLTQHVRDKHLLLVLDNFEHVLSASPLVTELLAAGPRLQVLVTSQALLHVRAEREYRVEPLAVPTVSGVQDLESLEHTPAVALFVERARTAKPTFALSAENAEAVAGICRRLEGLPLAIELAAARTRLLSPKALLARLEQQLKLLVGGADDLPARQRTMRGAIRWSYDLLEPEEQRLLRRLAIFAGGASLEAAEALCASGALEVLDGLGSLVDKSLLREWEQADGEVRFLMLEVLREFALEQLEADAETEATRHAHAQFFLEMAEEAAVEIANGPRQAMWLARLETERDNVRAALGWLIERDAETCLRLAVAVRSLWGMHGPLSEGRHWLGAALERSQGAPARVRATALHGAGSLARVQGDMTAARVYAEELLRLGRETGDAHPIGWASHTLGALALEHGDLPAARVYLEESLARGRELDDDRLISGNMTMLGEVARDEGAWGEARALYEQALALYTRADHQVGMSLALSNLGAVACAAGDLERAGAAYRAALEIEIALGSDIGMSDCLDGLAAVAAARAEWTLAARLGGAAEVLREETGTPLERLEQRQHDAWVGKLRSALDAATLEEEWVRGRTMGIEQAVREARQEHRSGE